MRPPLIFILLFAIVSLKTPSAGVTAEAAAKRAEDQAARRAVQTLYLSRQPADHLKAVQRVQGLPPGEAVKLLVQLGLTDRSQNVRRAAYEALLAYKDDEYALGLLQKALERESRKTEAAPPAVALIAAILASPLPVVQANLDSFLDVYVASTKQGLPTVLAVADELGTRNTVLALASLRNLTAKKCCAKNFACRRAAVQAIVQNRRPEVVAVLIEVLGRFDGEVRADVVRELMSLTRQQFGNNVGDWREWWRANKESYTFPHNLAAIPPAIQGAGRASFYGFVIHAKRLVFVIDISSSMQGPRLATAKHELIQAINDLPEDAEFALVAFNNRVTPWARNLQPATYPVKRTAVQFVEQLQAGGMTATFDALDAAFLFNVEAVYFISD